MRILLVDDSAAKIKRLRDYLLGRPGINQGDLEVAQCAQDARKALAVERFDILILDIALPRRAGDDPDAGVSLELLEEIAERDTLQRPRQIIGTTAYGDLADRAAPYFADRLWTVLRYDQTSDEWLSSIGGALDYLAKQAAQPAVPETHGADVCILTALDEEMEAVHALPWGWQPPEPLDDSQFIRRGAFNSAGRPCSVVTATAPRMGMVATALLTAKVLAHCRPRLLVMAGICAGVPTKVSLGDPIFAETTWDWQSGKREREKKTGEQSFAVDPHFITVPDYLRARALQMRADQQFWDGLKRRYPGDAPAHQLRLQVGPVPSGSVVLADSMVTGEIRGQKRSMLGVEMEVYGMYAAAESASRPRPSAFAIKSVCDFADEEKNDNHRKYAAYTSANAVKEFLERYATEVAGIMGT